MALMAPMRIDRHHVRDAALPVVVCEPRHAEGREPVQDRRAQRVPGREVGDVVEADLVDVEDCADECAEADRVRAEVKYFSIHSIGKQRVPSASRQREVPPPPAEGEQAEHGECEGHEPAAAKRADADDEGLERGTFVLDPVPHRQARRSTSATPRARSTRSCA